MTGIPYPYQIRHKKVAAYEISAREEPANESKRPKIGHRRDKAKPDKTKQQTNTYSHIPKKISLYFVHFNIFTIKVLQQRPCNM